MRRSDASGGSGGPGGRADASLGRAVVEISRGSRSRSRLTLDETPRLLEGAEATGCLVGGDAEGVAEHLAAREATVGARGGGVGGVRGCLGGGGRGLARDGRAETPGGYHPGSGWSLLMPQRLPEDGRGPETGTFPSLAATPVDDAASARVSNRRYRCAASRRVVAPTEPAPRRLVWLAADPTNE